MQTDIASADMAPNDLAPNDLAPKDLATKDLAPKDLAPSPARGLVSIPFLLLRVSTAGGAFATGFIQTLVFARVLTPDRFSLFILVGAVGYSLWLCDLGLAKILFVQLRTAHLVGKTDRQAAGQATAVTLFYVLLAAAGALVCFLIMASRPANSLLEAADLGLFFLYIGLNLAWVCLRSLSIAVDEYVFYEKLELVRRVGNMATILAMLIGLPFTAFLVGSNLLWAVLVTSAVVKLLSRGAMAPRLRGFAHQLKAFFQTNRRSIARSGTFALSDIFIYTFPYYVVPWAFGLGAPIIILEATFRVFRGASVIYSAACDLAIPGQTRALAARDAPKLIRTTLIAAGLCCLPAAFACGLLIFASKPLFAFLLGSAATVPPTVTPILVVMLLANLVQMVAQSLLLHAGFFREISRICASVAVVMVLATAIAVAAKLTIVEFLGVYAAVYSAGALYLAIAAYRGPILAAASPLAAAKWKRAAEPAAAR
jgi:O-antigen/teichoic acid export membrane protein